MKIRTLAPLSLSVSLCLLLCAVQSASAVPLTTVTTLAVTSGAAPVTSVASGTVVTLTATVTANTAPVTIGQVNFCDASATFCTDIHILGTAPLTAAGTAAFKFVPGGGSHSYKAVFVATPADATSSSAAASLSVSATPTTTAIAQTGSAGKCTLTATVSSTGALVTPTGTVSFLDTSNGNAVLATANLAASATATVAWTNSQSPTTQADPQSIAVADFNGDGIPDLATGTNGTAATGGVGYLGVLIGNGDGTFKAATNFAALASNRLIAAAPFITGGPLDIISVSNSASSNNNVLVFFGNGTGGGIVGTPFSLQVQSATGVATGDFNGDGKQDFVVIGQAAGQSGYNVVIYLGKGDGTFNAPTIIPLANSPVAIAVGNFHGAGTALDIAVAVAGAGGAAGNVTVFLNDGGGNFSQGVGGPTGVGPTAMVAGDFNRDGKLDLAVVNATDNTVSILLGNGDSFGTFTAMTISPPTGATPTSIAAGDFDGDGKIDLAVTNASNGSSAGTVTSLLGNGDGSFNARTSPATGIGPASIASGNFNGDATADLAVANLNSGSTSATGALTVLLSQLTLNATATKAGLSPAGTGTHLIDASYPGDTVYASSVSATTGLSAQAGTTTTTALTLAATPTTSTFGQQVVLSATLTPFSAGSNTTNSESITFFNGATSLGTGTLASGVATLNITSLPVGTDSLTAKFAGDANFTASTSAAATETVAAPATTTLALIANPTTSTFGQQVVLTATLAPFSAGSNTTNGEIVTFFNGAASLGTGTLASGVATLNTSALPVGADSLTAKFAGDANFTTSTSAAATETVAAAPLPVVSLTPTTLTFTSQALTTQSAAQNLTLMNTGLGTLNITSITASTGFVETTTCGSTLAASSPCTIAVKFAPTVNGAQAGTLTVVDNAAAPHTVTLTGAGPTVTVGATSSSLNITAPGGSGATTINIVSVAGFSGTVNLTCAVTYTGTGTPTSPPACSLNPTQVTAVSGSTVTTTLTVTTTAATGSLTPNPLWPRSGTVLATLFLIGLLPRRRWKNTILLAVLGIAAISALTGCAVNNGQVLPATHPGTTIGNYQVTVTATSTGFTAATTIPLTLQ